VRLIFDAQLEPSTVHQGSLSMIAIHHRVGSYSEKWLEYCESRGLPYRIVDCFNSSIMTELADCTVLLWHWTFHDYKSVLVARQIIASFEQSGGIAFPSTATCWHYDDKVGQKYLLEALQLPLVPSHVFFKKEDADLWLSHAEYPLVFKLRGGAGSENVSLVASRRAAQRLVSKAFGTGFKPRTRTAILQERLWHLKRDRSVESMLGIAKGFIRLLVPTQVERYFPRERQYIYFQEFQPGNDSDIRIIVIGDRAFGLKRMARRDDFRASGSGDVRYDPNCLPIGCVELAFRVADALGSQSVAMDFVFSGGQPKIVEISYAFNAVVYLKCPGYWDRRSCWHEAPVTPEFFMIEDVLASAQACRKGEGRRGRDLRARGEDG
jgi:glutathione synthase/RimK-type ligase-like ATP-grasp enzyme